MLNTFLPQPYYKKETMTVTPLSQRDPRWKNKYLGFSKLTIGSYGCTLVSLTVLLNYIEGKNYTPDQVNENLKKVKAFSGALLYWSRVPLAYPSLKWIKRAYNYNNVEVGWYVYGKKLPVLVEVNASSIGAVRHWVLFIGNRQMCDPWVGKIEPTNKYPLTGYSLYQRA